jgi:hypothetical protein
MKTRQLLPNWILILAGSLLIMSCATTPSAEDEPLYGTWANEQDPQAGKYVHSPDGTGFWYREATDDEPAMESRFTIEEKSTDEDGNTHYKVLAKWDEIPYDESLAVPWYVVIMIDPSGDVMESVASEVSYPARVNRNDPWYRIHYRQ